MRQKRRVAFVSMRLKDGEAFKAILKERHLTQVGIARSVGVSEALISLLISGDRGCTAELATLIVHALGPSDLTVAALFVDRIHPVTPSTPRPVTCSALPESA